VTGKATTTATAPSGSERYADVPPGVVYLEKRNTFWRSEVEGDTLIVTTGAIGAPGRRNKRRFKNPWKMHGVREDEIEAALKRGYRYVLMGKPPQTPAVTASDEEQEARIVEDPTDDALAVYADWLQEHGDIRGELAALQIRLASNPDDKIASAVDKLLWEHRVHFYGPLAIFVAVDEVQPILATWRAGWMDKLELACVQGLRNDSTENVRDVTRVLPLVGNVASAKFLRELIIARPYFQGRRDIAPVVAEIAKLLPLLPALRRLTICRYEEHAIVSNWALGSLAQLWKQARALEYVSVTGSAMVFDEIDLPACRELRIETCGLDKTNLRAITDASWPALETLSLWFGTEEYGCSCTIDGLAPILDGSRFPKLRHLGLKNSQLGNEILEAVARSKIVRRLETLDLSMSHVTTDFLERHAKALSHLRRLDLSRCRLDKAGEMLAQRLCKEVDVANQDTPRHWEPDGYRYCAVGE
jgi:uncharacterized protein (TIGR02996 family)